MSSAEKTKQILSPGNNCWKIEEADVVSFLIDADAYFYAFREAAKLAKKNIYICGWDIDSRMVLLRDEVDDGYPLQLGKFLNALASEKEDLHIYILVWDFVRFMGIDREWFSQLQLDWKAHRNIHFQLDQKHPIGASLHHKIVVIDDTISFVGGLDLTKQRWDTTSHRPDDSRRQTFDGKWYRPHHDIQIMVAGQPSVSLGLYFRDRWQLVSGNKIQKPSIGGIKDNWPVSVKEDIEQCSVAISRTQAQYEELPGIYEAEKLYLDSICKAKKYIYIENQYLTATKMIEALSHNLKQDKGPEIIIVLPFSTDGWLSQNTMDMLRTRAISLLREADKHQRLGIFYAHQDGLEGDDTIKIHSKLMIIDDEFVRIGSSNLNNRSMGFDAECDVAVELEEHSVKIKAVRNFRDALLAEHLGVRVTDVQEAVQRASGSIVRAIEALRGNSRSLEKLEEKLTETIEYIAEGQLIFDPDRPIKPVRFIKPWMPIKDITKGRFKYFQIAIAVLFFVGLAVAWRYSLEQELVNKEELEYLADRFRSNGLAWLYVFGAYGIGSILMVPITLLISVTVLVFGTYKGFVFALLGSAFSGAITYWIGRLLGRETVRSLAGNKINTLSRKLGKRGIVSTFLIRLMPVAPYGVVNIVAGASHIRFRDFIIGTFLGMIPGIFAVTGIIDRGYALITNPDGITIVSSIGLIAVILTAGLLIKKKVGND